MENGNLSDGLRQPAAEATINLQRKWCSQLVTGLTLIHSHRVIYGDISCRSIRIDGDLNVVLADFGYSSMLSIG